MTEQLEDRSFKRLTDKFPVYVCICVFSSIRSLKIFIIDENNINRQESITGWWFFMVFTIEDIRKRIVPIVVKYGIDSFSLFGSYARDEATEDSDLDFVMDDGDLKGLQYVSLVLDLEDEFNCHVDVISKGSSNKKFLNKIKNDEVLLYERKR